MKKEVYACDICGTERKDANHWFVAHKFGCCLSITTWEGHLPEYDLCKAFEGNGVSHLCGQACVHKFLDEFMSKAN